MRLLRALLSLSLPLHVPALASAGETTQIPQPSTDLREQMHLCTDGKSHYMAVLLNHKEALDQLYYGDGKRFYLVPPETPGYSLGKIFFRDPRHYNPDADPKYQLSLREHIDLREFSSASVYPDKNACRVQCGERKRELTLVDPQKARATLAAASFERSPRKFKPYALARDDQGTYYYVENGFFKEQKKSFRLYVGPKGNLKLQTMTNVVSDSEGDIFATKSGSLRLILGKRESSWVEKGAVTKLLLVPVLDNMQMIYTELGVYARDRLGTPCDDL